MPRAVAISLLGWPSAISRAASFSRGEKEASSFCAAARRCASSSASALRRMAADRRVDHALRGGGNAADPREIFLAESACLHLPLNVRLRVGQLGEDVRIDRERADVAQDDGVLVVGTGHVLHGDVAGGAGLVLDKHVLAKRLGHFGRHGAGHDF